MRNKPDVWTDLDNKDYPLRTLLQHYRTWCGSRSKPVSLGTIGRYGFDVESFLESLTFHGEPLVVDSLNPHNFGEWISVMRKGLIGNRARPLSEDTISSRVSSLKSFSKKYVYRYQELTRVDVLDKVERFEPPDRTKEGVHAAGAGDDPWLLQRLRELHRRAGSGDAADVCLALSPQIADATTQKLTESPPFLTHAPKGSMRPSRTKLDWRSRLATSRTTASAASLYPREAIAMFCSRHNSMRETSQGWLGQILRSARP